MSLFDKENLVKSNFVKWEKVGQTVAGVYVDKKVVPNLLKQAVDPTAKQTVYTLVQEDGTTVMVSGRGNQNPSVIPGLEASRFGEFVGLKYEGDKESSKPGMHPAKIIRVYNEHEVREEVLQNYRNGGLDMSEESDALPDM